jgi:hypothetical protein
MRLIHRLKSGQHDIPLDADQALAPTAFATYTDRKSGEIRHVGVGWRFVSRHDGKYEGHSFELVVTPEHLDQAIIALQTARERFAKAEIPAEVEGLVTVPAQGDDDD